MSFIYGLIPEPLFLDISGGELLIILIVAFLVFGPQRIPEIARKLGRGLNEIKKASSQIRDEITKETKDIKENMTVDIDKAISKTDTEPEQKTGSKTNNDN